MLNDMRALIIGSGSIGQRHMRNLVSIVPRAKFVLLRHGGGAVSGALGFDEIVVPDLAAAVALKPTLAILATPSARHIDVLPLLIEAGIPTYVEKPVVTEAADAIAVRKALDAAPGLPHTAGFNLRHLGSLAMAKSIVASGKIGTIARASFTAGQWLPDWRKGQDYRQNYSSSKLLGGGVIFDLSHELDAARLLLGEIEMRSCEIGHVESLEISSDSVACMMGRSPSGTIITVNLDYVARSPIRRYEIVGDLGTLTWDLPAGHLSLHTQAGRETITSTASDFDVAETYLTAMRSFVDAVAGSAQPRLQTLEDGLRSTELAIRATELGERI
jgi:predicted dehydrogenase